MRMISHHGRWANKFSRCYRCFRFKFRVIVRLWLGSGIQCFLVSFLFLFISDFLVFFFFLDLKAKNTC